MSADIFSLSNIITTSVATITGVSDTPLTASDLIANVTTGSVTDNSLTKALIGTLIQTSWQAEIYMALASMLVFAFLVYYFRINLRVPDYASEKSRELVALDKPEEKSGDEDELGASMSFLEHLGELRIRMIRALIALSLGVTLCFIFSDKIVNALLACIPVGKVDMVSLHPIEMFMTWIKVSVVAGIFVSFPFIFYEIWMFVAPGLYKREKSFALPLAVSAWVCFIIGALFCYFVVFRFALEFFASMAGSTVKNQWSISNYLNFMIQFLLAFAIVFEEPVVILLLSKIGVVTKQSLVNFRSYAVVILFILAAVVTPPDAVSQCLCAFPLLILYEVSIIVVGISEKRRQEESA